MAHLVEGDPFLHEPRGEGVATGVKGDLRVQVCPLPKPRELLRESAWWYCGTVRPSEYEAFVLGADGVEHHLGVLEERHRVAVSLGRIVPNVDVLLVFEVDVLPPEGNETAPPTETRANGELDAMEKPLAGRPEDMYPVDAMLLHPLLPVRHVC